MNPTIDNNWITENKNRINCSTLDAFSLNSLEVALAYEKLVAQNSDLVNPDSGDNIDTTRTLKSLYDRIACGEFISETDYAWAKAEIARLEKAIYDDTDARLAAVVEDMTHYVYAAGIYAWNGGAATTGSKTITGLLATDVVVATLHSQGAAETLVKAAAASGQINFTLSANGTDTTTKINYTVLRAKPVS